MQDDNVMAAFEAFVQESLGLANEFVDGAEEVEKIWVYASMQDKVLMAAVFYQVDGKAYDAPDVEAAIGRELDTQSMLLSLYTELNDEVNQLYSAFRESGQVPSRIIVEYDAATQSMNADFNHDSILLGPNDGFADAMDRWLAHLQQTGEASA